MDLIEWMSHKKNVEAYLKWKNDPITQAIINGLKAMNTPRRVMDANPNEALQELGFNAGQHSVLNAMMNLEIISTAEEDADISSTKEDYLMEFEGYTEDEADRIIKRMGDIDNG